MQLAHCGAAALSLACDVASASIRHHMRTGAGVTLEFGFRPGVVTLAKLMRPIDGRFRFFAGRAEAIPTGKEVCGSVATVRPEPSAAAFLDTIIREGVEHHLVLAYGDWMRELGAFCQLAGMELLTAG